MPDLVTFFDLFGLAVRTLYSNATLGPNDINRVIAEFWRGNTELYSFQQAWAVRHTNHMQSLGEVCVS